MTDRTRREKWQLPPAEIAELFGGFHPDPFASLGVHPIEGGFVARAIVPGAERVEAFTLDGNSVGDLERRDEAGFFEGRVGLKERAPLR